MVFVFSSKITACDMELVRAAALSYISTPSQLPVTYKLDGKAYRGIPAEFEPKTEKRLISSDIAERIYTGIVPGTELELRVETLEYRDYPVFEWTAYFTNKGSARTPVISDFYGADMVLPKHGEVTLYHNNGDFCSREGLETTQKHMPCGDVFEAASKDGRSCDRAWPYYRVITGESGYNIAIGWPGNWQSYFENAEDGIEFRAKQQYTNFYLEPGETARSPRIVLMAFDGDSDRGINVWRRWYFAHVLPRTRGARLEPKMCFLHGGGGEEFTLATEENQIAAISKYVERGATPDIWWIDAGWYPCKDEEGTKRWVRTGRWYPDPEKFPNGLSPVGKECAKYGIQFLLWFEPERVMLKYWPEENPKEYVIKLKIPKQNEFLDSNGLLDLGNPECRMWLTSHIKKTITDSGVKIYRQDFNGCPFPLDWWLQNDENESRCGITENKHIQGYLQFWDDLLFDTPDLWIDSCASGGRRNDIEAMRRAVALHPTDFGYGEHPVKQAFQKTWYEWTPYFRSIAESWDDKDGNYTADKSLRCHGYDSYAGHCAFAPATTFGADAFASDEEFERAKEFRKYWKLASVYTLDSDFFCLTPVRKSSEDYYSIQFSREDFRDGLIQVIRNAKCEEESVTVFPKGFEDGKTYEFSAPENGDKFIAYGEDINSEGLTFSVPKRSGLFWFYKEI